MILLALGANRPGAWGSPDQALRRALDELGRRGVSVLSCSPFYRTAPMGPQNQPDFVNAAALLETDLMPARLLYLLKTLERDAGRGGNRRWGARELDLDLLAYNRRIVGWPEGRPPASTQSAAPAGLILPHPGLHRRVFVLEPLCDIAPLWHHPVYGATAKAMLRGLKSRYR